MKEKKKDKHRKKHKRNKETREKAEIKRKSSGSSSSQSDEWVEKESIPKDSGREDWMSMTGMLKTYTKDDIKPREIKEKKHIDSYNPSTSVRELNPYWKDGGSGLPQTPESFRKSRPFVKPTDDDEDYYSRSSTSQDYQNYSRDKKNKHQKDDRSKHHDIKSSSKYKESYHRTSNWKNEPDKRNQMSEERGHLREENITTIAAVQSPSSEKTNMKFLSEEPITKIATVQSPSSEKTNIKYLSDEKMNKLAAKIVKAEIMGDTKLVDELKAKLEAAREYRKQNPNASEAEENERVMLLSTNSAGNSRPLTKGDIGDARSKGGKRKAETHTSGQRMKYFGNDDKYNLAQMFQEEKYGNNYDDEAQLARIAGKHKNPNDDLEDIFVDEISKNRNEAKDRENEKQRAITQHINLEKTLEGCEHCVDSRKMLKHLMVSCGAKVYLALPARKSLVKGHCIITTIQHSTCVTSLDEDVWEEIMCYRQALTKFFNSQDKDVVFFETATRLHRFPHMVINCIPLPRDVGDMASIYFKKALLECEAEWSMNKKVVELKGKSIRKGIPKGLPYFWIDFGMDPGFAHVIEDQHLFPKSFAEEIIAGILDLDYNLWKNPQKEYGDHQRNKVVEFIKQWKTFDTVAKVKSFQD